MTRNIIAAAVAATFVAGTGASAQIMVDEDLGTLGFGTVSRSGTTIGATNDASNYINANDALIWGGDLVYEFDVATAGLLSLDSNDDNAFPGDIDYFLLTGLTVGPNDDPTGVSPEAKDVFGGQFGPIIEQSGTFGLVAAGTYYLAVDSFLGDGTGDGEGAFAFDLTFTDFTTPAATEVVLDPTGSVTGDLAAGEVLFYEFDYDGLGGTIDTFDTTFDTELGLYSDAGTLIAQNDDAVGLQSELDLAGLPAGTYFLAFGGFNTTFGEGFLATSTSTGNVGPFVINGLSIVPEPTSLALVGLGGLAALRRRRA